MRANDKRNVAALWRIGATAEQVANGLNVPVAEVRDIFAKLDRKTGATP